MTEDLASKKRLPKFDRAWVLIDKLSGKTRGINALMVLHLFVHAVKQRGIVAVAVTDEGQAFFTNMGFTVVTLPEKNDVIRRICYLETSSLNMEDVQRCLGMDDIIFDICWRKGLSSATADKRIARC
jgi:phage terminase large subunit-like protein